MTSTRFEPAVEPSASVRGNAGSGTATRTAVRLERGADEADQIWTETRDRHRSALRKAPGDLAAALGVAETSRALNKTDEAERALAPFVADPTGWSLELAVSHALNAQLLGNLEEAILRWGIVRRLFPGVAIAPEQQATMLCALGRFDEAELLAEEAVGCGQHSVELLAARLHIAIAREDWPAAWERLLALGSRHPEDARVRDVRDATTLRIDAAFAAVDLSDLTTRALEDEHRKRWIEAAFAWGIAHRRLPEHPVFATGLGRALREGERWAEADAIFAASFERHQRDAEFRANHAQVAAARRDWTEAADRWARLLADLPEATMLWPMAAAAFREAGDLGRAEKLLGDGIRAAPDDLELRIQHALAAEKAKNWVAASERWDEVMRLRPDDQNLRNSRGNAVWERQLAELAGGLTAHADRSSLRSETSGKELALSFEGLGDQCEFGVVQRRLGADPIGLFRFAAISAETLTIMLGERFDRLGDPEHTELGLTDAGEYLIRDRRGLYHMHTFVMKDAVEPVAFLREQVRRLGYLKRKLLEDLKAGDKIFVHKSSHCRIENEALRALHAALSAYGPNTLLALRSVEDGHGPGSVDAIQDGLLVGHLRFGYGSPDEQTPDMESWTRVLEGARLRRRDTAAGGLVATAGS